MRDTQGHLKKPTPDQIKNTKINYSVDSLYWEETKKDIDYYKLTQGSLSGDRNRWDEIFTSVGLMLLEMLNFFLPTAVVTTTFNILFNFIFKF